MTAPTDRDSGCADVSTSLSSWALAPPIALPPGRSAGADLAGLAYRLTFVPDEARTGPYSRISLAQSATTIPVPGPSTAVTVVSAQARWRNEQTGSGRAITVAWHRATTTPPRRVTTRYGNYELPGILPGPIPADHAEVAAVLNRAMHLPSADIPIIRMRAALAHLGVAAPVGLSGRIRAAGDLVRWHDTPPAVRITILRALADVPNVSTHGLFPLAGHTTVAISITTGATRDVLLIDTATGELRAAEHVLLDPQISRALGVTVPFCLARTRIIGRDRSHLPDDDTPRSPHPASSRTHPIAATAMHR